MFKVWLEAMPDFHKGKARMPRTGDVLNAKSKNFDPAAFIDYSIEFDSGMNDENVEKYFAMYHGFLDSREGKMISLIRQYYKVFRWFVYEMDQYGPTERLPEGVLPAHVIMEWLQDDLAFGPMMAAWHAVRGQTNFISKYHYEPTIDSIMAMVVSLKNERKKITNYLRSPRPRVEQRFIRYYEAFKEPVHIVNLFIETIDEILKKTERYHSLLVSQGFSGREHMWKWQP